MFEDTAHRDIWIARGTLYGREKGVPNLLGITNTAELVHLKVGSAERQPWGDVTS